MYRTHNCGELRESNVGNVVKLSGWVHKKRDHGNLLFIDLRDHYGITQCVVDSTGSTFPEVEKIRLESIVTIEGEVIKRSDDTINPDNCTGMIEVRIDKFTVLYHCEKLPMAVAISFVFSLGQLKNEKNLVKN